MQSDQQLISQLGDAVESAKQTLEEAKQRAQSPNRSSSGRTAPGNRGDSGSGSGLRKGPQSCCNEQRSGGGPTAKTTSDSGLEEEFWLRRAIMRKAARAACLRIRGAPATTRPYSPGNVDRRALESLPLGIDEYHVWRAGAQAGSPTKNERGLNPRPPEPHSDQGEGEQRQNVGFSRDSARRCRTFTT